MKLIHLYLIIIIALAATVVIDQLTIWEYRQMVKGHPFSSLIGGGSEQLYIKIEPKIVPNSQDRDLVLIPKSILVPNGCSISIDGKVRWTFMSDFRPTLLWEDGDTDAFHDSEADIFHKKN